MLGLLVARKGSKGIKNKNFIKFCNHPLIDWTIREAKKSKFLSHVVLSTDCQKIAKFAKKKNISVPFIRPLKLAGDKAKVIDVIIHAINFLKKKGMNFDYVSLLEPTSPLREAKDIDNSINKIIKLKGTSLLSVCKCKASHPSFQFKKVNQIIKPLSRKKNVSKSRQELDEVFFIDGTIYLSKVNHLIKKKSFFSNKTIFFEVPKWKSIEIDDKTDFIIAENLRKNLNSLKKI